MLCRALRRVGVLRHQPAILSRGVHIEAKLEKMGLTLPPPVDPKGNYTGCVRDGNLLHLCGHISIDEAGELITGKVGGENGMSVEDAYSAAKRCGMGLLGTIKHNVGDLDKVEQIVKVVGFVNAVPEFTQHPSVINGVSDLMGEVFGDAGKHSRSAVGAGSLPLDVSVEVEMIVRVKAE